jgi:hypothetical protein
MWQERSAFIPRIEDMLSKHQAVLFSETSVTFYRTPSHHIPQDTTLEKYKMENCDSLKCHDVHKRFYQIYVTEHEHHRKDMMPKVSLVL